MRRNRPSPGERFGRLIVVGEAAPSPCGQPRLSCLCDCGNSLTVQIGNLRTGTTKSCGCWHSERTAISHTKHGHTRNKEKSPEYEAWQGMIKRTTNQKATNYDYYGGRGITVCERWLNFENFLADMGLRPSPRHSVDRKNNDGNYEPGNCWWATKAQQSNNQRELRRNNTSGARGVSRHGKAWQARICLNGKLRHIGTFPDRASASEAYEKARAEKENHGDQNEEN